MKKTVKFLSMVLALAMMFSLAACGGEPAEEPADKPAEAPAEEPAEAPAEEPAEEADGAVETVVPGTLTVATSPDFAPYEFYAIAEDGNPQLAGFDIALAGYVADYLGLKLEIIPMDFDGVLNELAAGSVDIGLAGLSPDPERANAMDFSDIYYAGGQSFVTVEGKEDQFKTLEDTNKAEYSIAAQNGSIQMDLANKYSADADIIALTKVTDIVSELLGGKIDGAYIETAVAEKYAENFPELKIVLDVPYESKGSAVGVMKGNESLLAGVNEAVAACLADGSMESFVAQANKDAEGNIKEGLLTEGGEA